MQLKALQENIKAYHQHLRQQRNHRTLYKWESQRIFQENWNANAPDFAEMYDHSLDNSRTRRLWNRENFEPKRMMLEFIQLQPDLVRSLFKDLFDESKAVENRIESFVFHCDELLTAYKEHHPHSIENNHYHQNYEMVALYLAFRYPEQYTLYNFELFQQLLVQLKAKNIPEIHDLGRYFKIMRTIYTFLKKEDGLLQTHQQRLQTRHYHGESLLLAEDFAHFLVNSKKS